LAFNDPIMTLVRITCPIALLSSYPIRLEWVLLANAATYALVGLIVEPLRQRLAHAK
jgi:ABC-type bacteriocin/lantibiotic exporter with double-glycine peptidase domain